MPQSPLRLVRRFAEHIAQEKVFDLPPDLRGMYVLYQSHRSRGRRLFDVVYVGMAARGGIRARLKLHRRKKGEHWTHFSVFEVWDNVRDEEIRELEGLFRHIYKHDSRASHLNVARGFKALAKMKNNRLASWA